jgi:hypothetical protein
VRSLVPSSFILALALAAGPAHADEVKLFQQSTCELSKGTCIVVTPSATTTGTARKFTFTAPDKGVAMVTFDGTMTCVNTQVGTFGDVGSFDFETQITTQGSLIPDYNEASGARFTGQLPPATTQISPSQTVNLGSTRRISYSSGGKKTVFLRYLVNQLDTGMSCSLWSASFSVVYVSN